LNKSISRVNILILTRFWFKFLAWSTQAGLGQIKKFTPDGEVWHQDIQGVYLVYPSDMVIWSDRVIVLSQYDNNQMMLSSFDFSGNEQYYSFLRPDSLLPEEGGLLWGQK